MTVAVDHPVAAVARVRIGDPAARATVLDAKTIETLEKTMTRIEAQLGLKGVIFTGCAPGRFLAGADLGAIEGVVDPQEGARLAARGQALFHRIARLGPITVAAIDGACLGGGLELALACRWILATDSPATRLGLPEVQLGILPGWGGTQRLPRRIGLARALDWILTGRRFDARSAERAGVVSLVVPPERLDEIAVEVADGKRELRRRPRPLAERLIEGTAPGRAVVAAAARKRVLAETHGRYPAPLRAIDVATRGLSKSLAEGLALEARALGDLIASPTSKELVRIFRLFEGAKKSADRAAADRVATAAVIGGGVMGAGIAGLLAENGIAVRLRDPRGPALVDALARFQKRIDERVRRKRLRAAEGRAALDRFQPTLGLDGVARADVVVEAIVEDLAAKKACLAEIGALVSATALVASNTSSLSVTALASAVPRPERVVGLHFFHPVERMPLVEVVRGERTSPQAVALACGIAVRLGKTPVVVADRPGFLVNRVLAPFLAQAAALLAEGLSIPEIDHIATDEGMPMGPFVLLDEVGLDVASAVSAVLVAGLGDRFATGDLLERLKKAGRLGKKNGAGFYRWPKRTLDRELPDLLGIAWAASPRGPKSASLAPTAGDRLMRAIADEASRALAEGVAASADDVDLACIAGIGYPPFRGGPLRDRARAAARP